MSRDQILQGAAQAVHLLQWARLRPAQLRLLPRLASRRWFGSESVFASFRNRMTAARRAIARAVNDNHWPVAQSRSSQFPAKGMGPGPSILLSRLREKRDDTLRQSHTLPP